MRGVSICSGIGGLDLAAEEAGIEVVAQVEVDANCRAVLEKHWPDVQKFTDLRRLSGDELGDFDLLFGGIPCQPYSIAGKMRAERDERDLWPDAYRIIRNRRPRWVLIENVANFARLALDRVWTDLEREGYEVGAAILPACACGAPHQRERCFTLAYSLSQPAQPARRPATLVGACGKAESGVQERERSGDASSGSGETPLAHTDSIRLEELNSPASRSETAPESTANSEGSSLMGLHQPELGRTVDGIARQLDACEWPSRPGQAQKGYEAPRVVSERPYGLSTRLKQLGNAVVWQQAYPIFKLMVVLDGG